MPQRGLLLGTCTHCMFLKLIPSQSLFRALEKSTARLSLPPPNCHYVASQCPSHAPYRSCPVRQKDVRFTCW